jgi:hypothetical protein
MPERDAQTIRNEIAAERRRLDDSLTALERELLTGVPVVVAGLVAGAVLVLRRRGRHKKPTSVTISWKLK